MDFNVWMRELSTLLLPMLLAITLHEVAHGWMADRLGDPTARLLGRLSLNPFRHLDPIGTAVFLLTRFIGWAKPVPVDVRNLRRPRQDMMWIALAGPGANLLLATASALLLHLLPYLSSPWNLWLFEPLFRMTQKSVVINLALMVFNLIPVPPLDGGRIVNGLLSARGALRYNQVEPFGFLIVIALIASGAFDYTLYPIIGGLIRLYGL